MLRSVTAQTGAEAAWEQYDCVAKRLTAEHPHPRNCWTRGCEKVLSYGRMSTEHWRKIRTNNPLEDLNSQIKKWPRLLGIFPNRASVIRLVGMVLLEWHEVWIKSGKGYIGLD